jgi:hypothetical protein
MSRLPLDLAAEICGIQPGTVRRWVFDGRITRHWDGYDLDELLTIRDHRDLDALRIRAGLRRVALVPPANGV